MNYRSVFESALALPVLVFLTVQQDRRCATLVAFTSFSYCILYLILRPTGIGQLNPPHEQDTKAGQRIQQSSSSFGDSDSAEWRSRILSTVNATVLTFGSLLCFAEWPYDPVPEGWTNPNRIWSNPVTFASLFVGFLQWDICWIIWHRHQHNDNSAALHHIIFIGVTHYVLWGVYFKKPYAWLSFTELSTPFLNARWYYAASGQKESNGYFYSSLAFAFTFLLTRVVGYSLGLLDLWLNYNEWKVAGGLHGVAVGLILAYLLNLFWSIKIINAVQRVLKKKKSG